MTTEAKKALRRAVGARRAEAHATVAQGPALERLRALLADTVGPVSFYWPIRTEIDPRPVMAELADIRQVCLPLTHGRAALTFLHWFPQAPMTVDGFGVAVPDGTEPVVPRTLVVPMLAFDGNGHRLGYGAGHYDRTLAGLRAKDQITAIGFAFSAQEVAPLPIEATDQPLDAIVTEKDVLRF